MNSEEWEELENTRRLKIENKLLKDCVELYADLNFMDDDGVKAQECLEKIRST